MKCELAAPRSVFLIVYGACPQRLRPESFVSPSGKAEAVPYPFLIPLHQLGNCSRNAGRMGSPHSLELTIYGCVNGSPGKVSVCSDFTALSRFGSSPSAFTIVGAICRVST